MNVTNSIRFAMAKVKSHIRMAILKSRICNAMAIFEESNRQEHGPGAVTSRNRCTTGKEEEFEKLHESAVFLSIGIL